MKILIVEDEVRLALALKKLLEKKKYLVDYVTDGLSGFEYANTGLYDLIILDIMLPKMDGIEVLKNLRSLKFTMPILMLTAKDEIENKVVGLDTGADDYMTKPFSTEELLARVRALLRRKGEIIDDVLTYEGVSLNLKKSMLVSETDSIKLPLKEFQIFEMLIANPEQIISKDRIIEKIWGSDSEVEFNNVEVYISFLRKKLQYLGTGVKIKTARGIGYSLGIIK
ncbi:MAG: DNA-binding response regulator [Treponema sp. CETP13]|nr:MAG: DNA-binding response regulator [Treponema sp. CETP13]